MAACTPTMARPEPRTVDGKYAYSFTGSGDITPITGQFRMFNLATSATSYQVNTVFNWAGYTMNSAVVLGPNNDAFAIAGSGTAGALLDFSTQADSTHTPHITWSLTDQYIGQPTLANGVLYVNDGGRLEALNELTGALLWSWTAPSGSLKGTMIATDNLLFATTSTTTYAIDLNTHLVDWSYGVSGNLALSDNMLFVAGSTGTLSAFMVPEPSTLCLTILGSIMLVAIRRPRQRRRA
jgi:outer membrane protein assembly factor BamB